MAVVCKNSTLALANRFRLHLYHFARGTYPQADGRESALIANRILLPLDDSRNGDSCVRDREKFFPMRRGCAYFIPAYHTAGVKLSEDMHFISIQFMLDLHNGVDLFSLTRKILEIENMTLLQKAECAFDSPGEALTSFRLQGLVYDFISILLAKLEEQDLNFNAGTHAACGDLHWINEMCTAETTVEELADLCHVCRDTFSRSFTRKHGITPKQFLNSCILHRACTLLSSENMKVCEIAKKLKFTNEFYFSRFFKKHTGMPPSHFRHKYFRS